MCFRFLQGVSIIEGSSLFLFPSGDSVEVCLGYYQKYEKIFELDIPKQSSYIEQ